MLESIGAVRVRFPRPEAFTNVNTRADLAAIAGRLEESAEALTASERFDARS